MNESVAPVNNRNRRRRRRVGVVVAITMIAGFVGGAFWAIPVIQNDLEVKVGGRLAADGIKGVTVDFSGQDGKLSCSVRLADPAVAKRNALSIKGVRSVTLAPACTGATPSSKPDTAASTLDGTTPGSVVASPITPVLTVSGDGRVTLSGLVANSTQGHQLVDAAAKAYGAEKTSSTLSIGTGAGPRSDALVEKMVSLISVFAGRLQAGEVGVANDKLYLKGTTADDAALKALTEAAHLAGIASTDIALAVDQPTGARLLKAGAVFAAGKFTLTGTVTSEGQMKVLISAAEKATSPQDVTTEVQVHASDAPDSSADELVVGHLATLIVAMPPNLLSGEVGFDGAVLYANGVYLDDATKAAFSRIASDEGVAAALEARPSASPDDSVNMQKQLNDFVATNPISFEDGKAILTPASGAVLDRVAAILRQFSGTSTEVQGHTDSTGVASRNLALSQQRADAIVAALVTRGVPASQLVAKGYGATKPKVPNDSAANRALNRRVEFVVSLK